MDRSRRLYWGDYLRTLANAMELRDWTVTTMEDPANEEHIASCRCVYGRRIVQIHFGLGFDQRTPTEQRSTLVHELLHAHTSGIQRLMTDASANISKTWVQALACSVETQTEYAVDAIADIIAPFMPLPPTEKAKKRKKVKDA